MANNTATATWKGGLKEGQGNVKSQSGVISTGYEFSSRFENGQGTNPEEFIGAALSSCFSMFLAAVLEKDGTPATEIRTDAVVTLGQKDGGPHITKIELTTTGQVPGIDQQKFEEKAQFSKENCPVSKALKSVPEVNLKATLNS